MSPAHSRPFTILWITLQMALALIGPHPESASPHLQHPYISEFRYVPQYHPSRNPDCASRWLRREFNNERFGHEDGRLSPFEGPFVDQDRPWVEIRTVLARCPQMRKEIRETSRKQSIRNCRRKLIVSMKINNVGKTNTREKFVLVDHVFDPVKMRKIRLRNPYVIKVRQEPLLHLYGLRFQGVVNAEAREEIINNHRANFTGCKDGLENPTCGQTLVNGEPVPFSQGFCCSCEDAQRAESFRSVAAKSNYYQRDDGANRARNRSVSSVNLFDNSEAQRQIETSGNEEHNRQVGNDDTRVTSRNASAVNGPLGERASPLWKQQEEEQLKNNSVRQHTRPLEGFPRARNVNRAEILPFVLENMFSDPSPSKGKIEAYIDAVYEQAMKERAMKQAIKHESDKINKDLLDENDLSAGGLGDLKDKFRESGRRILDRPINVDRADSSIYEPVADNFQNTTTKFMNTSDYDSKKLKSREFSSQFLDRRSNGRSLIQGSGADDSREPTTKLTKLGSEQGFVKMSGKEDNREFLELEECDRSGNFSENRNREGKARDRFHGVAHPENTFDYTPTFLAVHSRIPEESQFSRRTEKAFSSDDNGSFPTIVEFFIRSGISPGNNTDKNINYGIVSSTIKPNSFEGNAFAPLSKIVISETDSSTAGGERQCGFRASENISGNVNALRNASVVRKNLSTAAIRRGNTSSEENANVSTRISTAPAFTRLQNLSSIGISRLKELSVPTAVVVVVAAARSGDKSLTKILESKTRGSLPADKIQGFPDDFTDLYKRREPHRMYSSPERAPKDVNLKNSYKFWKTRRKLRKSKGAEKFRGDKDVREKLKRFGKSSSGLKRKRALPDFKRDSFRNKFSARERRFRRHLQTGEEVFNIVDARNRSNSPTGEDARRKMQAFIDYCTRPEVAHSKREVSNIGGDENSKKQVPSGSGHSYRKAQSEGNDNPFYDKDDKKNSVDKRIEDKFVRISNALKEDSDSTEAGIIQETLENFKVVTTSEVAKSDIPKIQERLRDNLFSRENGKLDELFEIHGDEITHEQSAKLIGTRQRSTVNVNSFAITESTMTNNEVTTVTSLIPRKDSDYRGSIFFKPTGPFPSSPIMRKLDYDVSREINFNKSKNPIYATEFAMRQTEVFTQELPPDISRGENIKSYFEITGDPLRTLSNSWASTSKEATSPEALNSRSGDERDETENARFRELNNNPLRMIAGNSVEPEGPLIDPRLLPRGSVSITKPEEVLLNNKEETASPCIRDSRLENSEDLLERSREREEIAELVDRIVRQHVPYTPIMPGVPTFDEITEAVTLPLKEETTVTQFTTTLATTTRITDVTFRPSIRRLKTTPLPGEMHDEVSLDEATLVDETEATATSHKTAVSKLRFRSRRPDASASSRAKIRRVPNKMEKNEKRRQKIANRVRNTKMNMQEKDEDHPWYRATEVQQIIAANRSKSAQKIKGRRKKHRYKSEIDYFQNTSPARKWTSSTTISSGVAQTRGKRSDLIHAAGDRDSPVFDYESEDEETRRSGRTGLNKNEKSPSITEPTELRSRIEKRLARELDYPASRGSSRRSCESRDQAQKLNAALQDIVARNVRFRIVEDNLDSDAQEKKRDMQGNLKNFTFLKVKDDAVRKFDKNVSSWNRDATSMSLGTLPRGPEKISSSRMDLSGSLRGRLETDRRSEKRTFGEQMVAESDGIALARKIAANVSENARTAGAGASASANDLSSRGAEPRERSSTGGILPTRARSPGDRDKSRETDTVIRGVKLMIPGDKGETRELGVAAKSVDKKITPSFSAARQRGRRKDARKINENPADSRVRRASAGKQYLRRPRGKMHDIILPKIINKIKRKSSSVSDEADTEKGLVGSERRAIRSNWHRSGRRLLSNGRSGYIESVDDEYYANDESETGRENDSGDNEAIARRDDLSYLENPPSRRGDRDPRKLVVETNRLADGNADVARTVMPEERTVAACDAAMLSDDIQANSEEAISRNNEKKVKNKNTVSQEESRNIEVVPELTDLASFNDDKMLKVPLEAEEKSIIQRTVDKNSPIQVKSFDNSENISRNSRAYEYVNEEPLSFDEENNLRDESLYGTQPMFNTREIINSSDANNQNLSSAGRILSNVDLSQSSAMAKNEGNIKISLTGKIQVHGDFNRTPMLISFDAISDGFSPTQPSVSTELSNTIKAIETTAINLPLNDSNMETTSDLLSISERTNDEASDSLDTISDEGREAGKTNADEVTIKYREKFSDLTRRSEEERKTAKRSHCRIEKRFDKYDANSRSAKQVFLTDYSVGSTSKMDRTNGEKMIFERIDDGAIDKLDSRSSASPVYFPDIFGSVLVNDDSLRDRNVKELRRRIDVPAIETNRSSSIGIDPSNITFQIIPLARISIKKPNDGRITKTCYPRVDPRHATTGGCYRMPATVQKLEITETTSRELQTSSNYRDDGPTETWTFPPGLYETTANDRNAGSMEFSLSTRSQNDVPEAAAERTSNGTPSSRCKNDKSINAIRVKNMMTIVRFIMKLLRTMAKDEESPCPRTRIGETAIHAKNVVINAPSHVERQKSTTDRTIIKSGRTLATAEWRSTITGRRMREETSPFAPPFTEVPSHPAASTSPTSSDRVSKDEGLSTLFETSTGKEVYTPTLSSTTSSVTPESFLFYEPARKPLRKDATRKNTKVDLTGVNENSNVSFKGSKDESGRKKSRLDDSQTNRSSSWPRDQNRSSADRLHFGKQGIAPTTNPEDKIGSFREKYLAGSKNVGSRRSKSTGVANDTVGPIFRRDSVVSRNALLERIGATGENGPESKRAGKAGVSDRRAETRTKLLNRSTRGGPPGDWIGEHRAATRRLPIDKKLRESCKVPGGTATPGKVVFRRVHGKINRPPDPNLVSGTSDSFKIEGTAAGNDPLAKLSTDDALSTVGEGLSSSKREGATANATRHSSTSSLMNDNVGTSRIGEGIVDERASILNKKRSVSERRDFRKGNRVLRKRRKAPRPTKRKTMRRGKKKRRKDGRRMRDISVTESQRRSKRHLLMTSLEPEYDDADDGVARLSRRYVAIQKRNTGNFRKSAGSSARRRRRGRVGSRTVDGSEADRGAAQIRGGQDCTDRRHPPNIDAAKYLESAHCLRFSDLWYSVYQLEDPIVEHVVYLQVYEKRALANGSTYWEDLTGDSVVRLGTFNRHHRGSQDTIGFAYKEVKMLGREEIPNLDVVRDRLLVPSSVTSKGSEYSAKGDSGEYLVVPASSINESGNECNKAGVRFTAFARQPDRCGRVRGTCLKNQPLAYRRRDAEARAAGRPGCYFLSNFASVPSQPIKYTVNGSGSHEFLALEYHSPHVSAIDIEVDIEAGYNAALAGGFAGRISEVYVDGRTVDHTAVTVVMTNMGLISMSYRSRITKCPDNLPESWANATFPRKIVQPRRDQSVSLDLYGELPLDEFHCSVQLLNRFGGLIATRRMKIRKMDRCTCMLHCLCVCVGDARGTACKPMSPELYHAAGFRGPVPAAPYEIFAKTVDILLFIVSSMLLLLFMGFLKWLIGLYIPAVGRWALDSLLDTSRMSAYFERELKYKYVITDEHGAPVHPDTRKRTVRICGRKAEFFLNVMLFLIFPFAICCIRLGKSFRRPVRRRCRSDGSKISLTSDRSERPKTIRVSTYGDSRDSRMEANDVKYVIDELEKSEESLRSRIRSKGRKKRRR